MFVLAQKVTGARQSARILFAGFRFLLSYLQQLACIGCDDNIKFNIKNNYYVLTNIFFNYLNHVVSNVY